jgi:integrase/recombinase XerD
MTPRRQRLSADRQLRGLSERTQELSVRAVRPLAAPSHKAPALITEAELRQYCLSLKNVKHYSRSARTIALGGIKFFSEHPLRRAWTTLTFVRPPRAKNLPVLLRITEGRTLLAHRHLPRYRGGLPPMDSCGLRLQAGTHLQVTDVDAALMRLHVRHGQGATDRDGPLPHRPLPLRRGYWPTPRHPVWICPAPGRAGPGMATATQPRPRSSGHEAFRAALKARSIPKRASVPTLRHSWATPRREAGVHRRLIQESLGPSSPSTTSVSTPLTVKAQERAAASINRLMEALSW